MQCQQCGTVVAEGTPFCPTCGRQLAAPQPVSQPASYPPQQPGYPPAAPYAQQPGYPPQPGQYIPPKKSKAGLVIGIIAAVVVVLVACGVISALFLLPAFRSGTNGSQQVTTSTVAPSADETGAIDVRDNTAAENAVVAYYDAINTGQYDTVKAQLTAATASLIDPGAFEGWSTTTFEVARSSVVGDTAYVYGRESQRQFGSEDLGVKFTLVRENGEWLIDTWVGVDEATVNGIARSSGSGSGADSLTSSTAEDIVSSLLQARQVGDSNTIRQLTTASFQTANTNTWLDGSDNSPYFTAYSIKSVKKKGADYVVTVLEQWNSGAETATYTVVDEMGSILVDSWTSK